MFLVKEKPVAREAKPEGTGKKASRSLGLDALRGIAILGMVLSGAFPHEAPWPGWMFHAQVGPPGFFYTPEVPGITWVDLVFPFFLFAMGAAFPLALKRKIEEGRTLEVVLGILKRGALLVFFAVMIRNLNWWDLKAEGWMNQITSLITFGCFFLVFMRFPKLSFKNKTLIKVSGFAIITLLLIMHQQFTDFSFNKGRNDIIIVVLANMAVFGAFIWLLTRNNIKLRLGILVFFAGIWFTHSLEGSWTRHIWEFHPSVSWMYQFAFLKYLCIVLPGTILGDLMLRFSNKSENKALVTRAGLAFGAVCLGIIAANLYGLYTRQLGLNLLMNAVLLLTGLVLLKRTALASDEFLGKLFHWAIFWILLGLVWEPLDGGIKKDPSSFSYWFLTSGLGFLAFIICKLVSERFPRNLVWKSVIRSGQNPMVAYVASSFLLSPIFFLTGFNEVFDFLRETNVYLGLVKTIVIVVGVVVVTSYVTKRKWFWKT